jgi:4-amino-4-deoxy-L-arabinose transferase-like glycosyltransferase
VAIPSETRTQLAWLLAVFAIAAAIRITSPSDVTTGDQPLQFAYVHDLAANGHWLLQRLPDGTPAAKPPLYNWLAGIAVTLSGSESEGAVKLPSLLAALAALLLTWDLGRRLAGARVAMFAGLLLATSPMFTKQLWFARTDMLLTMLIVAQFHAAIRMRPAAFWTAAALAMLTKGPIGILIPAASLSLCWWSEGTLAERWRALRWMRGLPLALVPFAIWFGAALGIGGAPVFDQLVRAETVDRFLAHSSKAKENRHLLYYIPHFLGRMAPASLLALVALARLRRRGRSEAVIATAGWWLLATLTLFSLIPSKRADRLFPLLPAACLLAARAIDALDARGTKSVLRVIAVLLLATSIAAPLLVGADALVILCATLAGAAAMALFAAVARTDRRLIIASLTVAMLALTTIYQYRVPVSGDTRTLARRSN